MPTPLFPPDGKPLFIKQGQGGSCYLLAALDCVFNTPLEEHKFIKDMFQRTADGGIEVRIKQNIYSQDLQPDLVRRKYGFRVEEGPPPVEVFTLSKQRVEEINGDRDGVQSNSLAVEILERISSYYFQSRDSLVTSVYAHSSKVRFRGDRGGAEAPFVESLLGLPPNLSKFSSIEDVIKLKRIYPEKPIYVAMDYGKRDEYGVIHSGHALRIDKIIPNSNMPGGYEFILVNPWDTSKRESMSLDEIQRRRATFDIFNTKPERDELIPILLKMPDEKGQYVIENPDLCSMISRIIKRQPRLFDTSDAQSILIEKCIEIHKKMPAISKVFNESSSEQMSEIILSIYRMDKGDVDFLMERFSHAKMPNDVFLELVVSRAIGEKAEQLQGDIAAAKQNVEEGIQQYLKTDGPDAMNFLTRSGQLRVHFLNSTFGKQTVAKYFTKKFTDEINALQSAFKGAYSDGAIDALKDAQLAALDAIKNHPTVENMKQLDDKYMDFEKAYEAKFEEIHQKAAVHREKLAAATRRLEEVVERMSEFPVTAGNVNAAQLKSQLRKMQWSEELNEARDIVGKDKAYEIDNRISAIYKEKGRAIDAAAAKFAEAVQEMETVIDELNKHQVIEGDKSSRDEFRRMTWSPKIYELKKILGPKAEEYQQRINEIYAAKPFAREGVAQKSNKIKEELREILDKTTQPSGSNSRPGPS